MCHLACGQGIGDDYDAADLLTEICQAYEHRQASFCLRYKLEVTKSESAEQTFIQGKGIYARNISKAGFF